MDQKPKAVCTAAMIIINVGVFLILSIAGNTEDVRLLPVNVHQNLIDSLVDRIFRNSDLLFIFTRIRPQAVYRGIGMDIFRIDGCQ